MLTKTELATIRKELLGGGLGDNTGLSWAATSGPLTGRQSCEIPQADRVILRDLAQNVAEIAARSDQHEKMKLWKEHNALALTRPLIFCDPESAWHEIFPAAALQCNSPLGRIWEFKLRKEIHWGDVIKDDRPILPEFRVQTVFRHTSRGLEATVYGNTMGKAYHWDSPLKDTALLKDLKPRRIVIDYEKTELLLNTARDVFHGILEVFEEGSFWWSFGLTGDAIMLRGFEQMMLDMYDHPDFLHGLMAFLLDEAQQILTDLERCGALTPNAGIDFVGTGGYGYTDDLPLRGRGVNLKDLWGFSESQESVGLSRECFQEFIFPYQLKILERFGLNIYGCCEPLERWWDSVRLIPRLRKVTVSPWSDPFVMAEMIGKDYVYIRKVNPAHMALPFMDEASARKQLRDTFSAARAYDCRTEVLLRDVITLGGNIENAARWTRMANEESARVY